jgi:hypothetical protein
MGWKIILGVVAALVGASPSLGQALPTAAGPGAYLAGGVSFSRFQADYGENYLEGITGYVDANLTWRYGIEGEARYLVYHQLAQTNEITYLAGPRISFRPKRLRPYLKFLVGRGIFNYPYGYAQGKYFVMAPGGGVDFEVGRLNVRLVDVEYQKWPNFGGPPTTYKFGTLSPYGVSFGVSYKFFNGKSWIW